MRPAKPIPMEELKEIERHLKTAKSVREYRYLQVLSLRGKHKKTLKEISVVTDYSVQNIGKILKCYFVKGLPGLLDSCRAPRKRKWGNMTFEYEQVFISGYLEQAKNGGVIIVSAIKEAYEKQVGKRTSLSVIYNLLHRHNWRKIAPRPFHPKRNATLADGFKKTLAH